MKRDELIVEKIKEVISGLCEIDEMISSRSSVLQSIDWELSDLDHILESNKFDLSDTAYVRIGKKRQELRNQRRALNNEREIESTYLTHKSKLIGTETRQFLATEIFKTVKQLKNEYKYRVLTDEQIKELTSSQTESVMKKRRGRPPKVVVNV